MGGNPSKSTASPEAKLDLIYLTQDVEKRNGDIEILLRDTDGINIKSQQRRIGEKIENKWIGVCEAMFDDHIDVIKSIPKKSLPRTEFPGMIIMIGKQHMKERGEFVIQPYYPDKRIHYVTIAGFPGDTYRARRAVRALIEGDQSNDDKNTYNVEKKLGEIDDHDIKLQQRHTGEKMENKWTGVYEAKFDGHIDVVKSIPKKSLPKTECQDMKHGERRGTQSLSRTTTTFPSDKTEIIQQSLLSFLDSCLHQNFSEVHSNFPSGSLQSCLMKNPSSSTNRAQFSQKEYKFLLKIGEEPLRFVVHDVSEMSNLITLRENEKLNDRTHIVMDKDGINENCVVNALAVRDIRKFIQELPSDGIDVISYIQDETKAIIFRSFLESKFELVQFDFLRHGSIPEHPYISVCPAKYDSTENPKIDGGLLLTVHDTIEEAKIQEDEKGIPTIHVLFGDSMIDDKFYLNQRAKDEIYNLLMKGKTVADEHEGKGTKLSREEEMPKTDVLPLPPPGRKVHIRYLSNLPRKAFTDFIDRNIRRIKPVWKTGEDPVEEGSLCIVVCFTLSRLRDDISAVVKITPKGCTNMLVVIQNCREGISPGPMLKNNPDDCFTDFTNILYGDGECYDCDINSEAKRKIQSFVDSN